jgi:hypothetical protein
MNSAVIVLSVHGLELILDLLQRITHATFSRNIVYRNPKLYDEDGIELSGSDSDEDGDAITFDENPYREIHIDRMEPFPALYYRR